MGIAGFGGLINGILHYGGNVKPRFVRMRVPTGNGKYTFKKTIMLGLVGNVGLGLVSGFLIFLIIQVDVPMFQHMTQAPTGQEGLYAFFAGFGGTFLIDKGMDWFEKLSLLSTLSQMPEQDPERVVLQNLIGEHRVSRGSTHPED